MKRPSCVHRHRLYRKETTAAWTTRPRTASMKSVKNKRAAAGDTATTLPDGITTCGSPAGHQIEAAAPATALAL